MRKVIFRIGIPFLVIGMTNNREINEMNLRDEIFTRLDKMVRQYNVIERQSISSEIKDIINNWIAEAQAKINPVTPVEMNAPGDNICIHGYSPSTKCLICSTTQPLREGYEEMNDATHATARALCEQAETVAYRLRRPHSSFVDAGAADLLDALTAALASEPVVGELSRCRKCCVAVRDLGLLWQPTTLHQVECPKCGDKWLEVPIYNASSEPCDTVKGACSCGGWHQPKSV